MKDKYRKREKNGRYANQYYCAGCKKPIHSLDYWSPVGCNRGCPVVWHKECSLLHEATCPICRQVEKELSLRALERQVEAERANALSEFIEENKEE